MVEVPGSVKLAHPEAIIYGPAQDESIVVTIVPTDPAYLAPIVSSANNYNLSAVIVNSTVKVSGNVEDIQTMFGVVLSQAILPNGVQFRSRVPTNTTEAAISVPDALDSLVLAVLGLDNRPQAQPHIRPSDLEPLYTAQQIAQLYNFPTDVHGEGQCVAVIELGGGYSNNDTQAAGIPPANVYFVGVDGATNNYSGNPNSADGEVALDIQVIGSIASKCRIGNYTGPNTDQGFYDAVAAAVHDSTNKPSAISISWGQSESGWTQQAMQAMNTLFGTAMAAGIPVFAASGDNGSSDGASGDNADFPASATNCMGCGGTVLPSIANEAVWHDSGGGATGGGQSKIFTKPPYQSNIGFLSMRGVPDVAGDAAPSTGYAVHLNNQTLTFGGTSAVAPLWAAWAALARQKLGTNLGDLHGKLYPLIGTAAFHDITQGNNGSQSARTGYDTCTGCGTPNGTALIAALGGTQPTQYTVAINGPAIVIAGQSVSYTATLTPSQPGATYKWLVAGAVAGTGQTLQTIFPSAGNIVLTCNVVVAQNQTVSSTVTITVQTAPVPPPSTNCRTLVDTNCASVQAQLKALAASDQGGGTFSRATVYAYAAQWLVYNQQVLDDAVGSA